MSRVDEALAAEGLDRWLARRLSGDLSADDASAMQARFETLDLLLLGALADRVRAREVGDVVRIHVQTPASDAAAVELRDFDPAAGGASFVRRVACARLLERPKIPVRIDVDAVGVQIAQVALAFGADELVAPIRRSLVTQDAVLRERELAALVRSARRTPRIVEWLAGAPRERDVDATTDAKKTFRAPGRESPATRSFGAPKEFDADADPLSGSTP